MLARRHRLDPAVGSEPYYPPLEKPRLCQNSARRAPAEIAGCGPIRHRAPTVQVLEESVFIPRSIQVRNGGAPWKSLGRC